MEVMKQIAQIRIRFAQECQAFYYDVEIHQVAIWIHGECDLIWNKY